MRIAVITEVSTKEKNKYILDALQGHEHDIWNAGMKGTDNEPELTYIHTGFLSALFLASGAADLVIGGCGTGQGYLNSVLQYPGVICGLVESPLDAWLFRQINGGNCLSLALNKGFGWAGEENLRFIFDYFFKAPFGEGFPIQRKESQKNSRKLLADISMRTHKSMEQVIANMPEGILLPALNFPEVMKNLKVYAKRATIVEACEMRLMQSV